MSHNNTQYYITLCCPGAIASIVCIKTHADIRVSVSGILIRMCEKVTSSTIVTVSVAIANMPLTKYLPNCARAHVCQHQQARITECPSWHIGEKTHTCINTRCTCAWGVIPVHAVVKYWQPKWFILAKCEYTVEQMKNEVIVKKKSSSTWEWLDIIWAF